MLKNKYGQIWIETVIYTLIGLTIIIIIMSVATPQIEKVKDRTIVKNMVTILNEIDNKITQTVQAEGNLRNIHITMSKGSLEINSSDNFIRYVLDNTRLELSEPGEEIEQVGIKIKTEKMGSRFRVILTRDYNSVNITFNNKAESRFLHAGGTTHNLVMQNMGDNTINEPPHIDFTLL